PSCTRLSTLSLPDALPIWGQRHRRSRHHLAGEAGPLAVAGSRQVELPGSADRCPAVVHTELGVDVLGVRPHGVQRHYELASDFRDRKSTRLNSSHVAISYA